MREWELLRGLDVRVTLSTPNPHFVEGPVMFEEHRPERFLLDIVGDET